jgi:hypothetical protein
MDAQPKPSFLRLVPAPTEAALPAPDLEVLCGIESKVREWLGNEGVQAWDALRGACLNLLERVHEVAVPDVSEGSREFLRMVREAEAPAPDGEQLGWGAAEFLRLAEVAAKVVPLPQRR